MGSTGRTLTGQRRSAGTSTGTPARLTPAATNTLVSCAIARGMEPGTAQPHRNQKEREELGTRGNYPRKGASKMGTRSSDLSPSTLYHHIYRSFHLTKLLTPQHSCELMLWAQLLMQSRSLSSVMFIYILAGSVLTDPSSSCNLCLGYNLCAMMCVSAHAS